VDVDQADISVKDNHIESQTCMRLHRPTDEWCKWRDGTAL